MISVCGLYALFAQAEVDGGTVLQVPIPWVAAGVLLAAFLLWCLINPRVGRTVARVFAVLTIGIGCGLLTWGIFADDPAGPRRLGTFVEFVLQPVDAIGCGAGALASGVTALFLTFLSGDSRGRRQATECRSSAGRVGLRSPELDQELWLG